MTNWFSGRTTGVVLFAIAALATGCEDQTLDVTVEPTIESVFAINQDGSVALGWTGLENGVPNEIDIHRSSQADFVPSATTMIATISGTATRFDDVGVMNGQAYYYRLVPIEIINGQRFSGTPTGATMGRPFDYSQVTTISYDDHIQPIFASSCAVGSCHVGPGSGTSQSRIAHNAQFSLETWDDIFYGDDKDNSVIVPYRSSRSYVVFHANNDTLIAPVALPHMPLVGFNLPAAQVQTLIRWIDEGAKNEAGEVPFPVSPSGRIISVCASEDMLAVTDVATNFVIRYVPVGREADPLFQFGSPHHVKVDPQGDFFYVTLINSQELWKFSASTYELLDRLFIPFQPADLALSPTGDSAYVTSFNSTVGLVTLVNTETMQVLSTILGGSYTSNPHGIAISNDASRVFVGNAGSGNMTMINTADNSLSWLSLDTLKPFFEPSGISPYLVAITPDDHYLFVTDYAQGGRNVYVFDLMVDPFKPSRVIPIGGRSIHVAITPDGTKAFVCNLDLNSVDVISIPDFTVTTIANVGKQPHGVVFTPDGRTAYVTTENTLSPDPPHHPAAGSTGTSFVYVIDVASLLITRSIEVGAFGQGLAFVP